MIQKLKAACFGCLGWSGLTQVLVFPSIRGHGTLVPSHFGAGRVDTDHCISGFGGCGRVEEGTVHDVLCPLYIVLGISEIATTIIFQQLRVEIVLCVGCFLRFTKIAQVDIRLQ